MEQDRGEPMAKEKDEIEENTYGPGKYEDLIGIKGYKVKGQVVTYIADDSEGILPHGIIKGSLIFIDTKAKYKKGDLIIIKDMRNKRDGVRITKAVSGKEKDFMGRIFLVTTTY